jgi:hypothetical protein
VRKRYIMSGVAGVAAAATLAAVFWTSSGSGADRTGPLGGGGPMIGTQCAPARPTVTIALTELQNTTSTPIRVETFTLVNPHGLRLLGVDLAPLVSVAKGGYLLGAGEPYPPPPALLAATADVHWNDRRTLPMTMPPDRPGHSWNLVIGLERTAAVGTASYYQIQYQWHGQQYTWSGQIAIRLIIGKCS